MKADDTRSIVLLSVVRLRAVGRSGNSDLGKIEKKNSLVVSKYRCLGAVDQILRVIKLELIQFLSELSKLILDFEDCGENRGFYRERGSCGVLRGPF